MKPSEIIQLARRQTGCTEDIVTKEEAYRFLNFVIEDFWSDIRSSDSWYGFDYLNINVTAGGASYQIDEEEGQLSNKFPISKLNKVWYKLRDWKWRDLPIHFVDKMDINRFPDQWEPRLCFIVNNTVNLVPTPKEDTVMLLWGFDYNWELWYNEETTSWDDDEEGIRIPKRWHYVLVEWLKYRMYGNMWVNFETARANSRSFYDSEKYKALQNIVDRGQLADTPDDPDLDSFIYW